MVNIFTTVDARQMRHHQLDVGIEICSLSELSWLPRALWGSFLDAVSFRSAMHRIFVSFSVAGMGTGAPAIVMTLTFQIGMK